MVKVKRETLSGVRKSEEEPQSEKTLKEPDDLEEENSYENMVEGRLNIGARNPLILALQKLALKDYSVQPPPYSGTYIRELLEEAFGKSAYESLFDPASGSPVYYGIYAATARLADCPSDARQYRKALSVLGEDPARKKGPGVVHKDCPYRVKSKFPSGTINGVPVKYRDETLGQTNEGMEFNDPVQGCVADCWLISVLSSVALVETVVNPAQKKIIRAPPINVYPPYPYWGKIYNITTTDEYYTTNGQTLPYFGGLNPAKPIPPAKIYESWASYYEKCFAGYYQVSRVPPFNQNNNPEYDDLNFRGTFGALADITGRIVSTATQGRTRDYLGGTAGPDKDVALIEKIRTSACNSGALNDGVVLYTKKPAITYTYTSASYVPGDANLPVKKYLPAVVAYNCLGIPANHAFSLLGLYQKNDIKYVVLRNPWGIAGDKASFSAGLQSSLADTLSLPAPYDTLDLGAEGIFGLSSVNFMRYFEAFGWTIGI